MNTRKTPPLRTLFTIATLITLALSSCNLLTSTNSTPVPTTTFAPVTISIDQFDAEALALYGNRGEIQTLMSRDISTNPDLTYEMADPSLPTNQLPAADVLVPAITLTPELEAYMVSVMQQLLNLPVNDMDSFVSNGADWYFRERLMHSTHHLKPLVGISQYDVRSTTNFIWRIVSAAMSNGQILHKEGTTTLREAYVLVGQVDGRRWILIMDAKTGAPITTFLRLRGNNINLYNETRTSLYIARQISFGAKEITATQLPKHIQDAWSQRPSVVRILWWAASYQAKMLLEWAKIALPGTVMSGWQAMQQWASGVAQWKFTPVVMFVFTDECGNIILPSQLSPGQSCGTMQ